MFKGKNVRRFIYNNEWWFVVKDVVLALTDSANVKDCINKMRARDGELSKGYGQFIHTFEVPTAGGKQKMNCANTEGIFRIIQSIPSPKADDIAGTARKKFENRLGRSIVNKNNFLPSKKKLKK